MKTLICFLIFLCSFRLEAKLLKIIHTNDLHSYFTGYKDGRGGYAKVKTKIDELKMESRQSGIDVLHLDGGDFGEGTSFFFSEEGVASVRTLGMLGTDIAVIGNHDHMMGGKMLSQQIQRAHVQTKFISANLVQTPEMELSDIVKPYADIERGGIKIRVIGLSTPEPHFLYPLLPGLILPPNPVAVIQSDIAKKEGKELIIALTHLGKGSDKSLAKASKNIHLIVGGHSHDRIEEVLYVKNKNNINVPIVQTGAHGLAVGELLVDLKDDGKLEVVKYKLHDIKDPIEEDQLMAQYVQMAVEDRNEYFGGRWDEVIGFSTIPLTGYVDGDAVLKSSCWGAHMAKMTKDASNTHMGLHLSAFEGVYKTPGVVTFGDIVDNFPHIRQYGDNGWEIATINMKGSVMKTILRAVANIKDLAGVNLYGVKYSSIVLPNFIPLIGGRVWAFNFRINGQRVENSKTYTMSFPGEVGHVLKTMLPKVTQAIFPSMKFTGIFYWPVMENYVRENSPIGCMK